jgi:hypothetical protein
MAAMACSAMPAGRSGGPGAAQQQIILQDGNSLCIGQGLAPQRVTEAGRQLAPPQLLQLRAAIVEFAQGSWKKRAAAPGLKRAATVCTGPG